MPRSRDGTVTDVIGLPGSLVMWENKGDQIRAELAHFLWGLGGHCENLALNMRW